VSDATSTPDPGAIDGPAYDQPATQPGDQVVTSPEAAGVPAQPAAQAPDPAQAPPAGAAPADRGQDSEPVQIDSAPFVVAADHPDGFTRYGVAVGVRHAEGYQLPSGDQVPDHDVLTVAWFDGSTGDVRADEVERPELS
jgi:hypothetical protein